VFFNSLFFVEDKGLIKVKVTGGVSINPPVHSPINQRILRPIRKDGKQ
jgi:hypothetical protein